MLTREAGFPGRARRGDRRRHARARPRRRSRCVDVDWEVLEPLLDPDEAVARGAPIGEPERYERGDFERGLAEADVVVEAEYRTQTVLHNSMETHQSVCEWDGDDLNVYISTQFIWGVREDVAEQLGIPPDKVRVVCEYMGGGFGAKNEPGDYTFIAAELATPHRPAGPCALTPPRGEPRQRQPQRHHPAARRRRARATGR